VITLFSFPVTRERRRRKDQKAEPDFFGGNGFLIVFDLECGSGHRFEGWFRNSDSFEGQARRKLVTCPICGDTRVRRVLSPVATKTSRPETERVPESIDYRKLVKEIVDYVTKHFEDVGSNFTKEALKMHYGVREKRNIKGSATWEEEKMLRDEKIEFFKLPLPRPENDKNN
jgi:hypothetical protein